jgi:hypothetical protein
MNQPKIIVASLPRTGASLVMQMLNAAGVPCSGEYPAFEPDAVDFKMMSEEDLLSGHAHKLIDPHVRRLPTAREYRIILLSRSKKQQALSIGKMMGASGQIEGFLLKHQLTELEEGLAQDERKARNILRSYDAKILEVSFESLIEHSYVACKKISMFLGMDKEQTDKMAAEIVPRKSKCLHYLLEVELMQKAEAKEPACEDCDGTGMTPGWSPSYGDPDNVECAQVAEPCEACYKRPEPTTEANGE